MSFSKNKLVRLGSNVGNISSFRAFLGLENDSQKRPIQRTSLIVNEQVSKSDQKRWIQRKD